MRERGLRRSCSRLSTEEIKELCKLRVTHGAFLWRNVYPSRYLPSAEATKRRRALLRLHTSADICVLSSCVSALIFPLRKKKSSTELFSLVLKHRVGECQLVCVCHNACDIGDVLNDISRSNRSVYSFSFVRAAEIVRNTIPRIRAPAARTKRRPISNQKSPSLKPKASEMNSVPLMCHPGLG